MKLFGVDVTSLISPQVKFLATYREFISTIGEERPRIVSLDERGRVVRELIVLRESKFPGRRIEPGYRLEVDPKGDGKLGSLSTMKFITIMPRMRKDSWIRPSLLFLGRRLNPEIILVVNDIPVIGKTGSEVKRELLSFLEGWGIRVRSLPATVKSKGEKEKVKAKIVDLDFLTLNSLP
ncbi:hypothetical protein GWK48_01090 [Metallosphaera tengchongensis]|uniref:Uncharacterized protein n=1 Tax=Metallosphaera tengchongensis TaxID=1532350 RepID=A0A6N0NQM5_9CREN|nr:hypothetical protein [Metallosphaera tengchongensis]QKQ99173.1 hypothetical protein GWK48_01090 [Metallosphaera tengchongensis]